MLRVRSPKNLPTPFIQPRQGPDSPHPPFASPTIHQTVCDNTIPAILQTREALARSEGTFYSFRLHQIEFVVIDDLADDDLKDAVRAGVCTLTRLAPPLVY